MSDIKSPLIVWMPKFSIDNKKNIFASFFTHWENYETAPKLAIFDYWAISDKKGKLVRLEPKEIITSTENKSFKLKAENALSVLTYEELTVTLHFIILVGQNKGYAVTVTYFSNTHFKTFVKKSSVTKEATEAEISLFLEVLDNWIPAKEEEPLKDGNVTAPNDDENTDCPKGYSPTLDSYIKAVYKEMFFLKNAGGKEYKVTNGRLIKRNCSSYVYCFDLEAELFLADDSPLTLKIGLRRIEGTVSFCENFLIIIELEEPIEDDPNIIIQKAVISSEPWKLLKCLNKCLSYIDSQNTIALELMDKGPSLATNEPLSKIQKGQSDAINHALNEPVTVIWGPPGTGKTYTMAKLAGEYFRQGKSVLIVSHSNISVDNVVKQIYSQFMTSELSAAIKDNKILRYGYVRDEELQKNPDVVAFNVVINKSSLKSEYEELVAEKNRLVFELGSTHDSKILKKIEEISNKIKHMRAQFKDEEKSAVSSAHIVATTASKLYSDSLFSHTIKPVFGGAPIYKQAKYDVVMFDEVSMAYVPQIISAASFASEHLICVGDFRQLSPIVQSDAKDILGKDLFEYLGICSGFSDIHPHPWLFMLDEQRRMHPDISHFSSKYVYHGLLHDHQSVQNKWRKNVVGEPFPSQPMTLIDLYTTCCAASKNEDNSRYNILSAVVSFGTALKAESAQFAHSEFMPEEKVGIITPYAAQTRLIRAMIQDYRKTHKTAISCATVHQFQGSERNTVIFDAVESYPSPKAGWLMSKNEGGSVTRLINVAITRARGKFITVTNKTFWKNHFEANNLYYSLVHYMAEHSHVVGYKDHLLHDYFRTLDCGGVIQFAHDEEQCITQVRGEINKAKKEVVLLLPQGTFRDDFGKKILDSMCHRSQSGINVSICRDKNATLPSEYEKLCLQSEKVTMPLLFIDNVVWYGVPVLQYSFSDKNTLYKAVTPTTIRFSGSNTVEMIRSLVDRSGSKKTFTGGFALYVKNNSHCMCGGSHKLSSGKKGFYLTCSECKKTTFLTEHLINSYLDISSSGRCPSCGASSYAKLGKFGWYVTCANGHIRKISSL